MGATAVYFPTAIYPARGHLSRMDWVTATDGLAFVRVASPSAAEQAWADALAPAINAAIDRYLGAYLSMPADGAAEVSALALRAFGYGWKYREAPLGRRPTWTRRASRSGSRATGSCPSSPP